MKLTRCRHRFKPSEDHTKYTNSNGIYVPSVTTVLKIINKSALVHWANSLGWKRKSVKEELTKSALIGTLTHGFVEDIINGNTNLDLNSVALHGDEVYDQVINSLNSFIKWWKQNRHRIDPIYIEKEMSCEEFGGTCDLICLFDGEPCIIDFKTSKDFYYTMFLQMSAYIKMYEYETNIKSINNMMILRLDKKSGEMADTMDINDVINLSKQPWTNREAINIYMSTFDKVVELYYDLYDISTEWGSKL